MIHEQIVLYYKLLVKTCETGCVPIREVSGAAPPCGGPGDIM